MVKIKDFTLASKNLGGGARAPRALHSYSTPAHVWKSVHNYILVLTGMMIDELSQK